MNALEQSRIAIEVVSTKLPPPSANIAGVSLANLPLAILKKYSSPKPVQRPAPRSHKKPEGT